MHVFITGATGWVGSALVRDLIAHGHRVTGLSRSEAKGAALAVTGATVLSGTLDDHELLRDAARNADAVAHLGFNHDFSNFAASCEQDRAAIETLGGALEGSDRPLIVTSGLAWLASGRLATEDDTLPHDGSHPRRSEPEASRWRDRGVRATAVRLSPSTHGVGETHGFIPILIDLARRTGVSAYPGEGANRWAGVHRDAAARLFRLVLERGIAEPALEPAWHAVAEEGIAFRDIAAAIGRRLGLPVESREPGHFGWFGAFAAADMAASSTRTRELTGWQPDGPGLIADIADPAYFATP
ncbi:MAG: SDR family oxidoreductase [Gluconacetobacter diazotrophicus]|nr:SDR family oxidoreductase [Gluconacetobacter diazotrophicus]